MTRLSLKLNAWAWQWQRRPQCECCPSLAMEETPISLDTLSGNSLTSHSHSSYYSTMEWPCCTHSHASKHGPTLQAEQHPLLCQPPHRLEAPTYLSTTNFFAFSQVGVKHLKPQRTLLMLHIHDSGRPLTWLLHKDFLVESTLRSSQSLLWLKKGHRSFNLPLK